MIRYFVTIDGLVIKEQSSGDDLWEIVGIVGSYPDRETAITEADKEGFSPLTCGEFEVRND